MLKNVSLFHFSKQNLPQTNLITKIEVDLILGVVSLLNA